MNETDEPIPLPPAQLEQIRREFDKPLRARLLAFAKTRAAVLQKAQVAAAVDPSKEAELLVIEAVSATILGHRRWDPSLPLYDHLCRVIRSQASNRVRHADRNRHVYMHDQRLDESTDGSAKLHAKITRRAPVSVAQPGRVVSLGDAARRVCQRLREQAVCKPATVTQLIDAYEAGCEDRRDVLDLTGMTEDEYRNARRILDRMLAALPDDLHERALDALESSYDGTLPLKA